MARPQPISTRNRILAALSATDAKRLHPHLEYVSLPLHQVLIEAHKPIEHVYFLESGLSSDTVTTGDGGQMDVGMIGREGVVGIAVVHEMNSTSNRSFMQVAGTGLRMRASELRQAMEESTSLRRILHRYAYALLADVSQAAGCAGRHRLDQRLVRWLLTAHDRLDGDDLPLTHEGPVANSGVVRRMGRGGPLSDFINLWETETEREQSVLLAHRPGTREAKPFA